MNEYKKRVPRDSFCTHFCTHSILPNAVAQYFQRLQPPQKTGSSPVPSAKEKEMPFGISFSLSEAMRFGARTCGAGEKVPSLNCAETDELHESGNAVQFRTAKRASRMNKEAQNDRFVQQICEVPCPLSCNGMMQFCGPRERFCWKSWPKL